MEYFLSEQILSGISGVTASQWFYALDIIGTIAFAISGIIRAHKRNYDLFGAFILAVLPAVGGGTLRDVLIGGERHPPFIFNDPLYLYCVFFVVILGGILSRTWNCSEKTEENLTVGLDFFDTVGLSAFTIIGAKVAVASHLAWFWPPLFAACTCAGGGILRDIVCGKEPGVLKGEIYEEIAFIGGLFFIGILYLCQALENPAFYVTIATIATMTLVAAIRFYVIRKRLVAFTLGCECELHKEGLKS